MCLCRSTGLICWFVRAFDFMRKILKITFAFFPFHSRSPFMCVCVRVCAFYISLLTTSNHNSCATFHLVLHFEIWWFQALTATVIHERYSSFPPSIRKKSPKDWGWDTHCHRLLASSRAILFTIFPYIMFLIFIVFRGVSLCTHTKRYRYHRNRIGCKNGTQKFSTNIKNINVRFICALFLS